MSAPRLHDLSAINAGLAARIDDLVARLYANARKDGHYWSLGDAWGAPGASLKIWRFGSKQGQWHDFSAGEGGNPLELVIRVQGGGDAGAGIKWAAEYLGHGVVETQQQREQRERIAAAQRAQREAEEAARKARSTRAALGLFLSGAPIAGTPAEAYLLGRAIDLRRLGRQPGALKFHAGVRAQGDDRPRPCLLAAVSGTSGFLTAHRHFLHRLADGRVVKASHPEVPEDWRMSDAKQAFGSFGGGCIPIARGSSGKPMKAMPEGEWIAAAEGVEDALSIALARPDLRVVATVSLGNLGKIPTPPQVGGVFWHRHRGDGQDAVAAYEREKARLLARSIPVAEVWAPGDHKDFNDWLQAERDRLLTREGA